jgi:hypothetical protein
MNPNTITTGDCLSVLKSWPAGIPIDDGELLPDGSAGASRER